MDILSARYTKQKFRIITFVSILCLFAIFSSLIDIVSDYYSITRYSLEKEINSVVEDAYHIESNIRHKSRKKGSPLRIVPPWHLFYSKSTIDPRLKKMGIKKPDMQRFLDIATDLELSKKSPIKLSRLDSIVSKVLADRKINSRYAVQLINPSTGKIFQSSGKHYYSSRFLISSEPFALDFENKKALRLILINPFTSIFERMGALLVISLLLSMFCLYGLWILFRTQSRQKKLMEVKNDFFGNTAHELKRPVAQLHLALDALSKPVILSNEVKHSRYLSISQEATRNMTEKVNMIMTLSMTEEGVFKLNYSQFNLHEELLKLKEQFTSIARKEMQIDIDSNAENILVKADRDHVCQCIANLIDNAIKYSGVSVAISITLQRLKDSLRVSVTDNGIGIAPEKINHIFDKYFRVNAGDGMPDGFGIGLSYVKAVVEKHNGRIEVSSEYQKGTEFSLYLPM